MKNINLNTKTVGNRAQEKPADTATFQGKMSNGRFVEKKEFDAKAPHLMAAASSTSKKKIINDVDEDTNNMISRKELMIPEAIMYKSREPTVFFERNVNDAVQVLIRENWVKDNAFPLCMLLIKEINKLERKSDAKLKGNYDFMVHKMSHYYQFCLKPALEFLQNKADTKCSWEYSEELNAIAKYFDFQLESSPDKSTNKSTLTLLFKKFADNELSYIDSFEDYPWPCSAEHSIKYSFYILNILLSDNSSYFHPDIIDVEEIEKLNARREILLQDPDTFHKSHGKIETRKEKEYYFLTKEILSGTTCMNTKRNYHNLLYYKLQVLTKENMPNVMTFRKRLSFLKNLEDIHEKYTACINEFYKFDRDVRTIMASVSQKLLFELRNSDEKINNFKKESLDLILRLNQRGLLNEECKLLYVRCTEQKTVTIHAAKTDEFTFHDCMESICCIFDIMQNDYNKAACMLKDLLNERKHVIKKLNGADMLIKKINIIKSVLYGHFFMEVFLEYNYCRNENLTYILKCTTMNKFKHVLIDASRYTFILKNDEFRYSWKKIACATFFTDIDKMSTQESFCEDDTDCLLYLLHIVAPEVPDNHVRDRLEAALVKCFRFFLKNNNAAAISVETAVALSQWVDTLSQINIIRPELAELHQQWITKVCMLTEQKDRPTIPHFSDELEQPAFYQMGDKTIIERRLQDTSFFQVAEWTPCNPKHTQEQTTTDNMNPPSSYPSHIDCQQAMYQQSMQHVSVLYPPPAQPYPYIATRQPSMLTMQPLQAPTAPHHVFIAQSTYGNHQFSVPPMTTTHLSSHSFRQQVPPEGFVQQHLIPSLQQYYSVPPMEYRPEVPLNSEIQQTLAGPSVESMGHNQLRPMDDDTIQIPAKNKGGQLNPEASVFYPTKR